MIDIESIVKNAKNAFIKTMTLDNSIKNQALFNIAKKIEQNKKRIFEANQRDVENAKTLLVEGTINQAAFERLKINEAKLRDLIKGLDDLIKLDDPVNKTIWQKELDDNLILKKISCPIGVIGVIFEARPDCFIQIASLIIKSGNCGILKGGSEAMNTNTLFSLLVDEALDETKDFPKNAISLVYSREDINKMLSYDEYINLIIPRGSNKLVKYIKENTKIPVLGHSSGICHIFTDENADFNHTLDIILDAKTQYPSACNAVETLLIHKNYPYFENLKNALIEAGVEIDENPIQWDIEYGAKKLSIKLVDSVETAIEHINKYGSGHTDAIISNNKENIEKFMNYVDSSSVFSNCSTRFSDGFRYGFGAEVGISTNKTHARGPVGLDGLTIYKYKLYGKNDTVAPYATGEKVFKHKYI